MECYVVLREGLNAGKKYEIPVSEQDIKKVFDGLKFGNEGVLRMGYIAGNKRGESEDEARDNKKDLSLIFDCKNEETAKKCVGYYKFSVPNMKNG